MSGVLLIAAVAAQDESRAAALIAAERALPPADVSERVAQARAALGELSRDSTSEVARRVHLVLGEALLDASEFTAAIEHLGKGCDLARAQGATKNLAYGLLHVGIAFDRSGDFSRAVAAAQESADLAAQLSLPTLAFAANNLLGATHERSGAREPALEAWTRCLELAEATGDAVAKYTVLNNLGVLLMKAGQLERATERLLVAQKIANERGDLASLAATVANLGDIDLLANQPAAACARHREALALREKVGAEAGIAFARSRLADALLENGEPASAIGHLEPALAVQQRLGLAPDVIATLGRLARAYGELDRPADALRAAGRGLELAEAVQTKVHRVGVLQALADAYASDGDDQRALAAMREAFRLDEEVDSLEALASFAAREAEFEARERERKIALLEAESALQASQLERQSLWRSVLLGGLVTLSIIAVLGWSLFLSRRRAHAALARTQAMEHRLAEAKKLESVALLAGGLAHDFNNLLTSILGNTELARLAAARAGESEERLDDIVEACRRAGRLAAELQTVSGRGSLHVEAVDVNRLIERTMRMLRGAFPSRAFTLELATDLPLPFADPIQLGRVLHNLVTNAAEALANAPGAVTVRTRSCGRDDQNPSDGVVIEVSDPGPGLSEQAMQRVFEPFFSTKPGGRGLGLATAHGIVHRHDGTITVDSARGRGSTFTVRLPLGGRGPERSGPAVARRAARGSTQR